MKKIIIAAVVIFLIVVVIFIWLLNRKTIQQTDNNTFGEPDITSVRIPLSSTPGLSSPTSFPTTNSFAENLQKVVPLSTADIDIVYSADLKKFIVTKKTANADAALLEWEKQNGFSDILATNPNLFIVKELSTVPPQVINEAISTLTQQQKDSLDALKTSKAVGNSFEVAYAKDLDTFIVQKKTENADKDIAQWAKDQNVSSIINNPAVFAQTTSSADDLEKKVTTAVDSAQVPISVTPFIKQTIGFVRDLFGVLPTSSPDTVIRTVTLTPTPGQSQSSNSNQSSSVSDVLTLISSYGLPPPTAATFNGANGYASLKDKLTSNSKASWNAKALLNGERTFSQKGGSILSYLNTAWIWFENGASRYPDVYELNCRTESDPGSQVSALCDSSNFQVAGYQPADRAGDFQRLFNQLYGTNATAVLQAVVDNSTNASQGKWSYLDSTQQKGLVSQYLANKQVPANISSADLSPNGGGFFSQKTQFYSLIAGKDPAMVAALNAPAVSALPASVFKQPIGSASRPSWANYINSTNMQLISNMIAALYLFDTNSSTIESVPSGGPGTVGAGGFVYYAQCRGQYDSYPLPNGGTFCYAGCGSAAASMILSSYIDKTYIPPKVIGIYKQKGLYLGTQGSSIDDGKKVIESQGIKTSDYIFVNKYYTADQAAPLFKHYIDAGWTIFTVTDFCAAGCGHFFWIVNVDSSGTIWANDSAYGQNQIPLNENKKYPYPKYKAAFAVRKN